MQLVYSSVSYVVKVLKVLDSVDDVVFQKTKMPHSYYNEWCCHHTDISLRQYLLHCKFVRTITVRNNINISLVVSI